MARSGALIGIALFSLATAACGTQQITESTQSTSQTTSSSQTTTNAEATATSSVSSTTTGIEAHPTSTEASTTTTKLPNLLELTDAELQTMAIAFVAEIGADRALLNFGRWPNTAEITVVGDLSRLARSEFLETDGDFLWTYPPYGNPRAAEIKDFDGNPVCPNLPVGDLRSLETTSQGHLLATIITPFNEESSGATSDLTFNCETGESEVIEPLVSTNDENEPTGYMMVAGRRFDWELGEEGFDIFNEEGISMNRDDPASTHNFNDDGSVVVYRNLAGRDRVTPVLTSLDTLTGDLLWEATFKSTIITVTILDDRVIVTLGNPYEESSKEYWVNKYVVLDLTTGEELQRGPFGFKILGLG